MTVLLHLTDRRVMTLSQRLEDGREFATNGPDGILKLSRRWRLCLVIADRPLVYDEVLLDDETPAAATVVAIAGARMTPRLRQQTTV